MCASINQKNKCKRLYNYYINANGLINKLDKGNIYKSIKDPVYIPLLQLHAMLARILQNP